MRAATCPTHLTLLNFDHFNYVSWRVQITKLLIFHFYPALWSFIYLGSKYSRNHPVLKHSRSTLVPQCERPSTWTELLRVMRYRNMLSSSINLSVSWILPEQHHPSKRNDFSFFTLNDKQDNVSIRATTDETEKVKGFKQKHKNSIILRLGYVFHISTLSHPANSAGWNAESIYF